MECTYVLARFVPRPDRDEARNFGVLLQCPAAGFMKARFESNLRSRLAGVADDVDLKVVRAYIDEVQERLNRFDGTSAGLPQMSEDLSREFLIELWQDHSGRVQFSEPRGGITDDPAAELSGLFDSLVRDDAADADDRGQEGRAYRELSAVLKRANLMAPKLVRPRYRVALNKQKDIPVDFWYRIPKKTTEVVIETVDLTSESFPERIVALSPTAVKFELLKNARGKEVKAFTAVTTGENGHSRQVLKTEIEALERHADKVFVLSRAKEEADLVKMIARDLKVAVAQQLIEVQIEH